MYSMITSIKEYKIYQYIKTFENQSCFEGLISSYDINKFKKHIEESFSFIEYYCFFDKNDKLNVSLKTISKDIIYDLYKMCVVYGYYVAVVDIKTINKMEKKNIKLEEFNKTYLYDDKWFNILSEINFVLEPKFDKFYDDEYDKDSINIDDIEKSDIFYHSTESKNIEKIQKIGLVPKSKNIRSSHPERIYLTKNIKSIKSFIALRRDKDFSIKYTILEINTKDLDLKIYKDPNFKSGFFIYDNISPERIKIVEEI